MAEVREVVAHKLTDSEARKRFVSTVTEYQRKYPGYRIEPTWRGPTKCEVLMRLTPVTKIKAVVTLETGHLLFVVTYPDAFRFFTADIAKYTANFRDEVEKHLGERKVAS